VRETQEQLVQSEKLSSLGRMVAALAHDLNNPLAAISGYGELLERWITDKDALDALKKLQAATSICTGIVRDLLSFAHKENVKRQDTNINEIIQKSIELQVAQTKTDEIEISSHLNPELPQISIDPDQMLRVFNNIINNSIQAAGNNGKIEVSSDYDDEWLELVFTDNGPGIPQENISKIFDPFFTTKERGKGTGLGLSTCFGVVKAHGGEIIPESEQSNGTTFRVRLPREDTTVKLNPAEEEHVDKDDTSQC